MLTQRSKEWWVKRISDSEDNPEPDVPFGIMAISPEILAKFPEEIRKLITRRKTNE